MSDSEVMHYDVTLCLQFLFIKNEKTVKKSMWWKGSPVSGSSTINSALFAQEHHRLSCIL
jgi:hypothetical protein